MTYFTEDLSAGGFFSFGQGARAGVVSSVLKMPDSCGFFEEVSNATASSAYSQQAYINTENIQKSGSLSPDSSLTL